MCERRPKAGANRREPTLLKSQFAQVSIKSHQNRIYTEFRPSVDLKLIIDIANNLTLS